MGWRWLAFGAAGAILSVAAAVHSGAGDTELAIAGEAPHYGAGQADDVANAGAIVRRLWSPGLDAGDDPQGLTAIGGSLWVATYRSDSLDQHRGPCHVYRLDPTGGRVMSQVAVPAPCGHAGGLASAGDGNLYIADTHTLFAMPLAHGPARMRQFPLGLGLVGALAASADGAIWLGTYREEGQGRLYRFDSAVLSRLRDGETLNITQSTAQIAIPSYAQGAAFDNDGRLWVSRSDTRWGELARIDPATEAVTARFAVAPGTEGIAFDGRLLWAVSEAGARHSYDHFWAPLVLPFFPLVYALDPARLR